MTLLFQDIDIYLPRPIISLYWNSQ